MAKISLAFSKSLESVLKFTCVSLFIVINLVHLLVPYIVTRIDSIGNAKKKQKPPKTFPLLIFPHIFLNFRQTNPKQFQAFEQLLAIAVADAQALSQIFSAFAAIAAHEET